MIGFDIFTKRKNSVQICYPCPSVFSALAENIKQNNNTERAEAIKEAPIPSSPKDLKASFMNLLSQYSNVGYSRNELAYNDAIIEKLRAYTNYWKLEYTSEDDYTVVKQMFEEEVAKLKQRKKEHNDVVYKYLGKTLILFVGLVIVLGIMLVVFVYLGVLKPQ